MSTALTAPKRPRQRVAATRAPSLSVLLDAAENHGKESEPDHEVGDLQDILRVCWAKLTVAQQREVMSEMQDAMADWMLE